MMSKKLSVPLAALRDEVTLKKMIYRAFEK